MYTVPMEVGATAFRADLKRYLDMVRAGEEVVVTDHGVPAVRLTAVDAAPRLEELTRRGVIGPPSGRPRRRASSIRRVRSKGSVAELVGEQRR